MKYELKKINLNETTLKKMLTTHSDAGYTIITAFRHEYSYVENVRRNNKLKQDIDKTGYSYIPVWGGFIEKDEPTGELKTVKERSFIITNFPRGKSIPNEDSEELKSIGKMLCKKYDQDSFLYKPTGTETIAYYLKSNGSVDQKFTNVTPTEAADIYFTNLSKAAKKELKLTKSFTYREGVIWLAQSQKSLDEAYKRMGEVFLRFND
jgi:hypothetical protein